MLHTEVAPYSLSKHKHGIEIKPTESGTSTRTRIYYLFAESEEDQRHWMNAFVKGSVWEPGLESLLHETVSKEDNLYANIRGMLGSQECIETVKDILLNLKSMDKTVSQADLDVEAETIQIKGVFNRIRVISMFEEAGFFIYPIPT